MIHASRPTDTRNITDTLGHVLPNVLSQHLVDEGLIADASATRFPAELVQYTGVESNRDQLARPVAEQRPSHAAHCPQLSRC